MAITNLKPIAHGSPGEPISIGTNSATLTIVDNDVATFTVGDLRSTKTWGSATFVVTLSSALALSSPSIPVTVNYQPIGGGQPAGIAEYGADYWGVGSQTVTFNPGDAAGTTKSVTIQVNDDILIEGTEGFGVYLTTTNPNADVSDVASGVIHDNDGPPVMQVSEVKVSSTMWTDQNFKDAADLEIVGSGLGTGYTIPTGSAAQWKPLPWRDINLIEVTFSQNIDPSSVIFTGANANVLLRGTLVVPTITAAQHRQWQQDGHCY